MSPEQLIEQYEALKVSQSSGGTRSASNRASELGFPCNAYLALSRLKGESKAAPGPRLAATFAEGRDQEKSLIRDLMAMGYEVTGGQKTLYWDKYQISGHEDFLIGRDLPDGTSFQAHVEAKSCSPFLWDRFRDERSIREHQWVVIRKWAAQCDLYMLLEGVEEWWLLLKNKASGLLKVIVLHLDLNNAETLLQRAETVNVAVAQAQAIGYDKWAETLLPALRVNDAEYCGDCPYAAICLPDLSFDALKIEEDPELQAALDAREANAEAKSAFEEADKYIKAVAERAFESGNTNILSGGWTITGAKSKRGSYTVEATEYWRKTIKRVTKEANS